MRLEQARVPALVPPRVLDQPRIRNDAALIHTQQVEDAELERRQLDLPVSGVDAVRLQVEHHVADLHFAHGLPIRVRLGPSKHRFHPGGQLTCTEGLVHVVVRAELESAEHILFVVARGEHDDGRGAFVADAAAHLEAIHLRKIRVQEHDVGGIVFPALQRLLPVHRGEDRVTLPTERVGQQIEQVRIVLNKKNLHLTLPSSFALSSLNIEAPFAGSSTQNTAPPVCRFLKPAVPPWASTIDRTTDRPMPMPSPPTRPAR